MSEVFSLQPSRYASDRSRIAFVVSLLTGRAREWELLSGVRTSTASTVMCSSRRRCQEFSTIPHTGLKPLDSSLSGKEIDRQLEFHTLATSCDWNEPALVAQFLEGLNAEIKDEVLARKIPSRLDPPH